VLFGAQRNDIFSRLKREMGVTLTHKMARVTRGATSPALRRIGAALICLAVLYFAGGGSLLHQHHSGSDVVCHVCQALHAPALAVSFSGIASGPQIAGWHDSRPVFRAELDEFSLLRSGRAPPSA
jgi:hypothetical protein